MNNLSFPLPNGAPHKILLLIGQAVLEEMFEIVNDDGRRTDAGPWENYKLTYEPSAQVS